MVGGSLVSEPQSGIPLSMAVRTEQNRAHYRVYVRGSRPSCSRPTNIVESASAMPNGAGS